MIKTYSRPYSKVGTEWEPAGKPKIILGGRANADLQTRWIDIQFDTAPGNTRSRSASVEISVEDMLNRSAVLVGGYDKLASLLAEMMGTECKGHAEDARRLGEENVELREKLDEAKARITAYRLSGGA